MPVADPADVYFKSQLATASPDELALALLGEVAREAGVIDESLAQERWDRLCDAATHAGNIFAALRDNFQAPAPATTIFRDAMSWCFLLCQRIAIEHDRVALEGLLEITTSYRQQLARRLGAML